MSEIPEIAETIKKKPTKPYSRPACLSDFFDEDDTKNINSKNKYNKNKNYSNDIEKNQQEFGNRRRIKP